VIGFFAEFFVDRRSRSIERCLTCGCRSCDACPTRFFGAFCVALLAQCVTVYSLYVSHSPPPSPPHRLLELPEASQPHLRRAAAARGVSVGRGGWGGRGRLRVLFVRRRRRENTHKVCVFVTVVAASFHAVSRQDVPFDSERENSFVRAHVQSPLL
jgi:hypothetical protein